MSRYHCQINLDEIGPAGQRKLASSAILCVGAGGLAHSALSYLAAAGVGHIGIVDGDRVEESNLHRQVLFNQQDVGHHKALVAKQKLAAQNPDITITAYPEFLTANNSDAIIKNYDVILDCSDNYYTRYLVNDTCYALHKPDVFAAVLGFTGYVTVFSRDKSPCYRCFYPAPPALDNVQNCADFGVFGANAGLFGLLQATEAVKILLNLGSPLYGELLRVNLLDMDFSKRTIPKQQDCALCGHGKTLKHFNEYATFMSQEITATQLKQHWDEYQFLDVREPHEYQQYNLKMPNIPFSVVMAEGIDVSQFNANKPLVIVCAHGIRSRHAAELFKQAGWQCVYSLKGGLAAWQSAYD